MDFIIKRKTLISMIFIGLTLLGYVSYKRLPVELFPNAQLPTLIVQVSSTMQMDPRYIESQAVVPLEGAIGTLEGIEKIESTVTSRSGTILIYYGTRTNMKFANLKLQEKISMVSNSIPEEFRVSVTRVDLETATSQFMQLQIRGTGGVDRIRNVADRDIKPVFESIDGIAGVDVSGGQQSSVEIVINEDAAIANGITLNQIRNLITSGSQDRTFAGRVTDGNRRIFVNVTSEYTDIMDIGNLIVKQDGPILLKDISIITFGVKEVTNISRVNGLEAVTISLVNDNQTNLIDLSQKTIATIERLNQDLSQAEVEIVVQNNNAEIMEKNINQIINLALMGGLLAIAILWFFLRNIRLVSIIAVSIPVSVYVAFNFFYAYGISINSLTLVGMALAIGMLIDNSVVVLENIYRLAGQGKDYDTAVKQGTTEVWKSIFAATLTTVTVFLPFIFSSDFMVKMIGKNIGVSIVSTLLVSLSVAVLLIPMGTHFFLSRAKNRSSEIFKKLSIHNRVIQAYYMTLKASIRNPAGTIIGTTFVFFAALLISLTLSVSTTQEVDTPSFRLSVTMPSGTTLEKADIIVAEIESRLEELPEKEDVITRITETTASVTVNLPKDWEKKSDRVLPEIKNDIFQRVRDLRTANITMDEMSSSGGFSGGGGGGGMNPGAGFMNLLGVGTQTESVLIKGRDFETMKLVADDLKSVIDELENIRGSALNVRENVPEVHLLFDMETILANNMTLNSITTALGTFGREYSSGATFRQGTEEYDIILKYDVPEEIATRRKTIDDLKRLQVSGSGTNIMEMNDLSEIVFSRGMGNIQRENQEKKIALTYSFSPEINESKELLDAARVEIDNIVSDLIIPPGVAVEVIHEENEFQEFYYLIAIAFLLIYMILAAVFESLTTPVVLMFSIPLAALGSLIALILTNNSILNANTLTGFLILLGVVVNNGIILIDYTNLLRRRGYRRSRALMTAGIARVRPIMITAATTVVALIPLAMGQSEYVSAIGAAFAITVIGGLLLSTVLTLIFIPTFYSGLENSIEWLKSLNWKVKVIQLVIFSLLIFLIYNYINAFLWQLITTILSLILVPAATWFVLTSLASARETIIGPGEPINIKVQSLVKIYEREGRFSREWKAGRKIRERIGIEKKYESWMEMDQLLWQLPLFGFLLYFTYFFLTSGFWVFIFSVASWFALMGVWNPFRKLFKNLTSESKNKFVLKIVRGVDIAVFWLVPLANLIMFQLSWHNLATVLILAVVWYGTLLIFQTGIKLAGEKTDIYRLEGRFKGIRKGFYKFVSAIPVIGKKRTPFRALNSVSLEIGNGMFGLLGPNGAGKTTLMRIICGILEQSYGKIWVNGIDTQKKREELQGLIGYLPQEFGTYENMSASDYLHYMAILKNITDPVIREERVSYVLEAVHMIERRDEKIGSYSGGMKQRIGIAQILLHLPRILVVDEPTAGLDPRERIRFRNLLVELSRERIVIFSTHIIEDISSSCNTVAVLNRGDLVYLGKPIDMTKAAENHVWQFYVPATNFRTVTEKHLIVHHMTEGNMVRVRCISENKPADDAEVVKPNLEDAYLWLLRKRRETQKVKKNGNETE
jgi:multidrug efflux pump subunit AcrB/ABC-type multidrug transport system ATPase subunit